jgi:hypothetical protein
LKTSNTGPNNYLEDIPTAFCQMGHNPIIIVATIGLNQFLVLILYVSFFLVGNVFSIAFFNFAGISVTKELSATTRMVLDNGRTLIIWAVSLALQWQTFYWLQIIGFILLVVGKLKFLFVNFSKKQMNID